MKVEFIGITSLVKDNIKGNEAESISCSYARCSRSPKTLEELRLQSLKDVEKSRKSNSKIVFDMGHKSIAEHTVFNIDITNISRLATEYLQKHRLASYTERSQRYLKINSFDFVPKEINIDKKRKKSYLKILKETNSLYEELTESLPKLNPETGDPSKEDARYILLMSSPTQIGMTVNARELESIIYNLKKVGLNETTALANSLEMISKDLTPSLIRYTDINNFKNYNNLINDKKKFKKNVNLINYTKNSDRHIACSILADNNSIFCNPESLSESEISEIIYNDLKSLQVHDSLSRAYEFANYTFEISLSASAFAQLKRHRMTSIISGPLDPAIGYEIPLSIINSKFYLDFEDLTKKISDCFIEDGRKISSQYFLTNANRRKILISFNLREFYHISRLRMDIHAQWEIRKIANQMFENIKKISPQSSKLCCGKHEFSKKKEEIYG